MLEEMLESAIDDLIALLLQSHFDEGALVWRGFEEAVFGEKGVAFGGIE